MARIRSINPCAPLDEDVATMSLGARLLWAFLPCHADRDGRLRDSAFTLKTQIMPADPIDVEVLLRELAERRHIIRYEVDGRRYIQIRNFRKHQNPHKNETPSTIPPAPEAAQNQALPALPEQPRSYPSTPETQQSAPADPSPDPSPSPDLLSQGAREKPAKPAQADLTPAGQTGSAILAAFGARWEKLERKPFFKAPFDERAAHDLAESINDIPDPVRRSEAWAEIVPAIERYMRTSKPFYAGHPFSAFSKDLSALRTEATSKSGSAAPYYHPIKPLPAGVPRPRP